MKSTRKRKEIKTRLRALIPMAPMEDFLAIEQAANAGHLRHLPPSISSWQATTAHIRHVHTDYDALLSEGYDRESARHFVLEEINTKLAEWGCAERIDEGDDFAGT